MTFVYSKDRQPMKYTSILFLVLLSFTSAHSATIYGEVQLGDAKATDSIVTLKLDQEVIETITDLADGVYRFDNLSAGSYLIEVTNDGKSLEGSSIQLTSNSAVVNHDIWLVPVESNSQIEAFELSGRVIDYSGNLYPGAVINFHSIDDFQVYRVVADELGEYSVILPTGSYQPKTLFDGRLANYPDSELYFYSDGSDKVFDIEQQMTTDFVIPFKEVDFRASFEGKKVPSTLTIAQYLVRPAAPLEADYTVIYHADTTERLLLPAYDDIEVVLYPNKSSPEGTFFSKAIIDKITPDATNESFEIALNDTGIVLDVSSVKDANGNALTDVCVRAANDRFGIAVNSCYTGDDKLYLQPATYYFSLIAENPEWSPGSQDKPTQYSFYEVDRFSLELTDSPITNQSHTFTMPIQQLEIKVTDESGRALADVPILLEEATEILVYPSGQRGFGILENIEASTNSVGLASMYVHSNAETSTLSIKPHADSGLNDIGVRLENVDKSSLLMVKLPSQDVDLASAEGNFVYGRLENLTGGPVSGSIANVEIIGIINSNTVKNGQFATAPVDSQLREFSFELPRHDLPDILLENQNVKIDLRIIADGPTRKDIYVPLLQIKGRVYDTFGNTVQGFLVSSDSSFGQTTGPFQSTEMRSNLAVVTNSDGQFEILTLPHESTLYFKDLEYNLAQPSYSLHRDQVNDDSSIDIFILNDTPLRISDLDGDSISNYYESQHGDLDPLLDLDNDMLTNLQEANLRTNPYLSDSDGDGISDSNDDWPLLPNEFINTDLTFDPDNDGFTQLQEVLVGTDPYDSFDFPILLSSITILDDNFRNCIDDNAETKNIKYVNQLWELDCSDRGIESLEGIQSLTSLAYFLADQNSIDDASALSGLQTLIRVSLNQNSIGDTAAFSGLINLSRLSLIDNNITDLSGLSELTSLYSLALINNNIVDVTPLSELTNLSSLRLVGNDGITCSTQRNFNGYTTIPIECLRPDLLESQRIETVLDFESQIIDPSIQIIDEQWGTTKFGFESEFSLRTSELGSNNVSSFSIESVFPEGLISFDLLVSDTGCCDRVSFFIDDENQNLEYDKDEWKHHVRIVQPGQHIFRWDYTNPSQTANESAAAYIDNITFPSFFEEKWLLLPSFTNTLQNNLGYLSFDHDTNMFELSITSLDNNELKSQINWPVNYKQAEISIVNTGLESNIGLFGIRLEERFVGRPQLFVRHSETGARVIVFNWPANWSKVKLKLLPDLNGDGIDEVAIQGNFKDGNRPQLVVKNGASGQNLRTFQFPDLWHNPEYMAFSDVTDDGIPEIALFGIIKRNGKPQIRIIDGTDPGNKLKSYTFPNNWTNVSWNRLSDSNNDGEDDWGLFGRRLDDGRSQLVVKDARNPRGALRIFAWSAGFDNAQFYSIPDMDADGIDEVAAGGYRSDINRHQVTVKNGVDRNVTFANYGWPNNWTDVSLQVLDDLSGDGLSEIALFGMAANGQYQLVIKHGDTSKGEFSRKFVDGSWLSKPELKMILDNDGDGFAEFLFIGQDSYGQSVTSQLNSSSLD